MTSLDNAWFQIGRGTSTYRVLGKNLLSKSSIGDKIAVYRPSEGKHYASTFDGQQYPNIQDTDFIATTVSPVKYSDYLTATDGFLVMEQKLVSTALRSHQH